MWAEDVAAMVGYHGGASAAAQLNILAAVAAGAAGPGGLEPGHRKHRQLQRGRRQHR
nr:hypothetical protein [Mycobacterium shinjukuense]